MDRAGAVGTVPGRYQLLRWSYQLWLFLWDNPCAGDICDLFSNCILEISYLPESGEQKHDLRRTHILLFSPEKLKSEPVIASNVKYFLE